MDMYIVPYVLGGPHPVPIPLFYHIQDRIKGTFGWKMLTKLFLVCTKKLEVVKRRRSHNNRCDEERAPLLSQLLPPVIKFPDFREPMLEN